MVEICKIGKMFLWKIDLKNYFVLELIINHKKLNIMDSKLMAFFLFLLLAFSCNKNEPPAPVIQEVTEEVNIYERFGDLVLDVGKEDIDAMFVHYLGFMQFKATRPVLRMEDVAIFEEVFENVTYAELLPQIAALDVATAEQLATLFPEIKRFSGVDERINFLNSELESEAKGTTYHALLEGYNNLLVKLSSNAVGTRDCVSNCVASNRYGFLWRHFYDQYCWSNPTCPPWGYSWQGILYADAMLRNWCQGACVTPVDPCDGVTCPYGYKCVDGVCKDKCIGVFCIQGYTCENGTCVEDPFYEGCSSSNPCPPGEQCIQGICVPW